jgi:two-component system, OmpR family, phosphate regulon response regulator PhoB
MCIAVCMVDNLSCEQLVSAFQQSKMPTTVICRNLRQLIHTIGRQTVDLVIVEARGSFRLPQSLFDWLRFQNREDVKVIVVGNSIDSEVMSNAFASAAVDVVASPGYISEIVARSCRALWAVARDPLPWSDDCCVGRFTVHTRNRTIESGTQTVSLTSVEFCIASLLFSEVGRIVPRERIAYAVWGKDLTFVSRTLEQHIYQLRLKFAQHFFGGLRLLTHYSKGYRLIAEHDCLTGVDSGASQSSCYAPACGQHHNIRAERQPAGSHTSISPRSLPVWSP